MIQARRAALGVVRSLPSSLRSVICNSLYRRLWSHYAVDPARFDKRHVLILGPAAGGLDDLMALSPLPYDDVVRHNNGLDTGMAVEGMGPYRCDVLFHSLTKEARPVTAETLRRAGVRLLVHRTTHRSSFLATLRAETRLGQESGAEIGIVPVARYEALSQELGGAAPSSGLVSLDFFLSAPVASLTVVGFTFFSTRYVAGYDDRFASDAEALAQVEAVGHHDPGAEARWVANRCADARAAGLDLRLGAGVEAALAAHG